MTEDEVVSRLGKPFRVYERATAPENYYVEGYSFEKRAIKNKLLIYVEAEPILYVYLDEGRRVEHVYIGGS